MGVNRITKSQANMITELDKAGYGPSRIAKGLGVSRTTVYYHLHPDKYGKKLEYVRGFRSSWRLEQGYWELEDG